MATTLQDTGDNHQIPQFSTTTSSKTSFDLEPNPFEQSFATKDHPNGNSKAPNISASSPQILTPGGRKLPPLVLSPNVQSSWNTTNFGRTGLTPNESGLRTGLTPGGPGLHSLNGMGLPGLNTPGSLGFSSLTPGLSSLLGGATGANDQQSNHLSIHNQQNPQQAQAQNQQIQAHPSANQQQGIVAPPHPQVQTQHANPQRQLNHNVVHSGHNSGAPSLHQSPVQNFQNLPPQTAIANGSQPQQQPQPQQQQPQQQLQPPTIPQPNSQSTISKTSADASPKLVEPPKRGRKKGSTNKATKVKNADDGPKRKKVKAEQPAKFNGVSTSVTAKTDVAPFQGTVKEEDPNDSSITDQMSEGEKRKHFLERNRVAASKCRQRKKQLMVKMETDLNFYLNEYNNLTTTIDQLNKVSSGMRTFLANNINVGHNDQLLKSVDNLLGLMNQTNYMSRLRGNAPSDIIPTVQPINPSLIQPATQQAPMNQYPQPQQIPLPQQNEVGPPQADLIQNSLPNTVPNSLPNSVPASNNNSSTNLQAMNKIPQQLMPNATSTSAPPIVSNGNGNRNIILNNDWTRGA